MDQQVKDLEVELKQKKLDAFHVNEQEIQKIKKEIEELRESRSKQRSLTSSVGSSVTIYPAATPTTPSPDEAKQLGGGEGEAEEGQEAAAAEEGKEQQDTTTETGTEKTES